MPLFLSPTMLSNMANTRIALKKGTYPAHVPAQSKASVKRCKRATDEIISKRQNVLTEFFSIEGLESYNVDTITFDDDITLRVVGNAASMDVRIVSLFQEGGVL